MNRLASGTLRSIGRCSILLCFACGTHPPMGCVVPAPVAHEQDQLLRNEAEPWPAEGQFLPAEFDVMKEPRIRARAPPPPSGG